MERVILAGYLIVMGIFDGRERSVPVMGVINGFLAAMGVVAYRCIQNSEQWCWIVLSALLGAIPGAVLVLLAHVTGQIGFGDGLVLTVVGMVIGYGGCVLLICFSLLLMSICCIGIMWSKKGNRNTRIPYLPFLTAVYLVSLIV